MAEALYRKYRPQVFEDVVGQDHIERTIKNAIEQDKVSHAYLFTGPRGTGKTTTARLLAKALLCEKGPTSEPDGTCQNCESIARGSHPDVYELDAASRTGVENVREEIIGRVQYAPTQGRYKVYIIDEVHMLSTAAFNALLKTLEEPPSHVVFILCTTDPQKVPETIHSRCQRFDFHRISIESIVSRLGAICVAEEVEFEGEALDLIAHRAEGGMRNALTSLEQLIAFGEGKVALDTAERLLGSLDSNDMAEIVIAIGKRDIARCFTWTAEYVETGSDLAQFVRDLAGHIRNMYILSLSESDVALEVSEVTRRELTQEMPYFGVDRLSRMLGVLGDLLTELRTSINPRLSFEIALTRMVRPDSDLTLGALAERVEALESGYSAVAHVSSAAADAPTSAPVSMPSSSATAPEQAPQPAQAATGSASVAPVVADVPAPALRQEDMRTHASFAAGQASAPASSVTTAPTEEPTPVRPAAEEVSPSGTQTSESGSNLAMLSNPAALQRIWQAALQQVKKEKAAYGVLFMNTKASFDEQKQELIIEFPAGNDFAYSAVQKPEALAIIEASLQKAVGGSLPFRFTKGEEGGSASPSPATTSAVSSLETVQPAVANHADQAPSQAAASVSQPVSSQQKPQVASAEPFASSSGSIKAPEPEDIPLDVYEEHGSAALDTPSVDAMPGVSSQSKEAPADGSALDESALESLLVEGFGGGVKIDVIQDE